MVPLDAEAVTVGWFTDGVTVNTKEALQPVVGCVEFNV